MYSKAMTATMILAAFFMANANAEVIYDNGSPVPAAGDSISDFNYSIGQQAADDFVLTPEHNVITKINWWGTYRTGNSPTTDNFTIRFYSNAGAAPALTHDHEFAIGHVGRVDTGMDSYGVDIYSYSATIPSPLTLLPGTTFWLSIINDTSGDPNDHWNWSRVSYSAGYAAARTALDTTPWSTGAGTRAFQFHLVPEPSTIALSALGLLGLLGWLKRRR